MRKGSLCLDGPAQEGMVPRRAASQEGREGIKQWMSKAVKSVWSVSPVFLEAGRPLGMPSRPRTRRRGREPPSGMKTAVTEHSGTNAPARHRQVFLHPHLAGNQGFRPGVVDLSLRPVGLGDPRRGRGRTLREQPGWSARPDLRRGEPATRARVALGFPE